MLRPILLLINRLAMPGTILRELGHYLLATAIRARVADVKWFYRQSMVSDDGYIMPDGGRVLGYVIFDIDSRSKFPALKSFIVGARPLLTCGAAWFLSGYGLHALFTDELAIAVGWQKAALAAALFWLLFASSYHILPSRADMANVFTHGFRIWELPIYPLAALVWFCSWAFNRCTRSLPGITLWQFIALAAAVIAFAYFTVPGGRENIHAVLAELGGAVQTLLTYLDNRKG